MTKEEEHNCEFSGCNKKAVKEVHLIVFPNEVIFFFCKEHFEKRECLYTSIYQPREIYDLHPKEDDKEIVQFT